MKRLADPETSVDEFVLPIPEVRTESRENCTRDCFGVYVKTPVKKEIGSEQIPKSTIAALV